jgi:HEAT repeat protein
MKAIEEINFQAYLESVLNDKAYSDCQHFYTPTHGAIRPKLDLRVKRYQSPRAEAGQEPKTKEVLSVLDGLRKYQAEHVLLVGKPGSGKSTALEKLLLDEAEKAKSDSQVKIPVLVRLRQYQTSALDLVRDFLMGHGFPEIGQLEQLLTDGRFLLLLDGVNELPSQIARTDLENFRVRYRKFTPMILTTRDLSLGGTVGVEHKLEMEPLTSLQMEKFVQGYLPEQHKQMLQQMGDRLRKFAETPLFLVMLCDVFENNQRIPSNLGEAFRDFAQIYDTKLKEKNVPTSENSQTVWSKILQHLAFEMMQGNSPTELSLRITKEKAKTLIQQRFNKSYDQASLWLDDLLRYHLIQEFSSNQIEFRHQLIQEYYAAEYLLHQLNSLDPDLLKRDYLNYLKWTETMSLMLGLLDDQEQTVQIVETALDIDLMLGARLSGSVQEKFQDKTVNLVIRHEIPLSVKIKLLELTRSDVAVPTLLGELKKGHKSIFSSKAAFSLWVIGSPAATEELLEILDHSDDIAREGAFFALGKINSDEVVSRSIKLLSDESINIQKAAAIALGNIGNPKSVPVLIQALESPLLEVCAEAAKALGKLGDESAFEPLFQIILRDPSACDSKALLCQHYAAQALGIINANLAFERLIEVLRSKDYNLCKRAAMAIEHLESEKIIQQLLSLINDRYDLNCSYISWTAASALEKIGNKTVIPGLLESLKNQSSEVRRSAAYALEKLGDDTAIPVLIEALEDEDFSVRKHVAFALGELSHEAAIPELIRILNKHNIYQYKQPDERMSAKFLGNIGSKDAIPTLLQVLKNSSSNSILYCYTAGALAKLDEKEAIPYLFAALENNDSWGCTQVIDCLSCINSQEVVARLCEFLGNENKDFRVRMRSAEILGRQGGEKAVTELRNALEASNTGISAYTYVVAEALGNSGDVASLPRLWQMQLKDETDASFLSVIEAIQSHDNCRSYKDPRNFPMSKGTIINNSMQQKPILRVVVASPGDVQAERDLLPGVIDELNRGIAADRNLSLELVRWETDAYPGFHLEGPQSLIDSVLKIEDCNILIGIFWKRFGTPVMDANSGTEHEFRTAYEAWRQKSSPQIMVYFNQKPYNPNSSKESEQWTQVLKFKENFPEGGLWWKYEGEADFERKLRNHLTQFIRNHHPNNVKSSPSPSATNIPSSTQPMIYNDYRGSTIGNIAHNVQGNQNST